MQTRRTTRSTARSGTEGNTSIMRPGTTSYTRSTDSGNAAELSQIFSSPTDTSTPDSLSKGRRRGRPPKSIVGGSVSVLNTNSNLPILSPFSNTSTPTSILTPRQSARIQQGRRNANVAVTPAVVPAGPGQKNKPQTIETPPGQNNTNELSLNNDSFLCAIGQLEEKIQKDFSSAQKSPPEAQQINVTNKGPVSPDIFGDDMADEDFLDLLPASQQELEPQKELPHHRYALNSSRGKRSTSAKRKQPSGNQSHQAPVFLASLMSLNIPDAEFPHVLMDVDPNTEFEPKSKKQNVANSTPSILGGSSGSSSSTTAAGSGRSDSKSKSKAKKTAANAAVDKDKCGKGPAAAKKKKKIQFKSAYTNRKIAKQLSSSGANELSKEHLSYMTEEEKLQLSSWGLPFSVVAKYKAKGVTSLFHWQLECLANEKVLEGRNLLYSAPTSAGKTLVAEILMLKRVVELGKKAIMILPFVSVCREKMYGLQEIFSDAGIRVEGFMGSYSPPGGFKAVDIAICTIEKANSLINRLLEEKVLSQLGTIVVDELHLIGDPNRGYLLELLLTKIKFMTSHHRRLDDSIMMSGVGDAQETKLNIQVIGMSATLPNLGLLSSWLDAELVTTSYRPVPLVERISFNGKIFDQLLNPVRDIMIPTLPVELRGDDGGIVYLSLETVLAGHSILIFCPTKAKCEALAEQIAREFYELGKPGNEASPVIGTKLREQLNTAKIREVLTQLEQCPGGLEDVLKRTVSFGVAYHHAGLTYDERDIIESSFKRCVLRVIVATSTLSAGVNLPARRVIISSPLAVMGGMLDIMTYHQMCGRAGRKGVDTEGESILVCTTVMSTEKGIQLAQSSLPYVKSALLGDEGALTSSMKRALLEVIASGIATHPQDVEKYAKCTLLSRSIDAGLYDDVKDLPTSQQNKDDTIQECLNFLETNDFIRLQKKEDESKSDEYMATQLGSACLASSLAPDEGITVYKELQKARKCFVLETELHVVYQVTPIYLSDQIRNIEWQDFMHIWNELSPEDKLVANLVGIEEAFMMRAMIGSVSSKNVKQREKYMIHQRFWAALALNDLVREKPISEVSAKYSLNKGVIQNLQLSASTFAGMVTAFCGRLGWSNLELLLSQFQERLQFGVQRELCDLVRLSTMNGQRARILYDNGIVCISDLAASDPAHIEHILHRAAPFQSAVHGESSSQRHIWMLGKTEGLSESEAAQKIVEEARFFIQVELGLPANIEFNPLKRFGSQGSNSKGILGGTESSVGEDSSEDDQDIENPPLPQNSHNSIHTSEENVSKMSPTDPIPNPSPETDYIAQSFGVQETEDLDKKGDSKVFSQLEFDSPFLQKSPFSDERNVKEEDCLTPRRPIAEMVVNNSRLCSNDTDAAFNDSFSESIFAEMSMDIPLNQSKQNISKTPYSSSNPGPGPGIELNPEDDRNMDISCEIQEIMENLVESSMDISECEEVLQQNQNKENFSPHVQFQNSMRKSSVSNGNIMIGIKHSTPVSESTTPRGKNVHLANSNVFSKTRLSAISLEIFPLDNDKLKSSRSASRVSTPHGASLLETMNDELNADLLAEFDKDFDSVASLMKTSLNISAMDDRHGALEDNQKTEVVPNPPKEMVQLSDSDAAAIQAIADDSKFESEDMFADFEANVHSENNTEANKPIAQSESPESDMGPINPEPEQGASKLPQAVIELETSTEAETSASIFEDSSEFLECSGTSANTSRISRGSNSARNMESTPTPILQANIKIDGKVQRLKVMKILAPGFIPDELLRRNSRIGIGLKLAPPKRPSSIARCGIGSRIIGGLTRRSSDEREHSISLYNGGSSIWVFQWSHSDFHDVRNISNSSSSRYKLAKLFRKIKNADSSIVLFDSKDKLRRLLKYFGTDLILDLPSGSKGKILDPKIGQWMLQFNEDNFNLSVDKIVDLYLDPEEKAIFTLNWSRDIVESFVGWNVIRKLESELRKRELWDPFLEMEMPSTIPLLLMEMNGFGLDSGELSKMKEVLLFKSAILEIRAFQLAGREFNLSSPNEIRKVLFREIGLKQQSKSKGTGKDVLVKLDHKLPQIIIEWRKITSALQKVVIPFQQEKSLETSRVHGHYSHFTVTGRVTMSDPSLQCIPRDFDLIMDFSPEEIQDIKENCKIKFGSKLSSLLKQIELITNKNFNTGQSQGYLQSSLISMRNVFIPCCDDFVLLSADYSQLELRILAHLSHEEGLLQALNEKDGDVFVSIASTWKKLPPERITSSMRQEAKGIVYGVIYGMGAKTLSEQMEVDESISIRFITEFMRTYPGVRTFLDKTVKSCRENGYVETISGRRRYLPHINSKNPTERAQGERQAVNSKIQGSAADLVKTAMSKIHTKMTELFPESAIPINWTEYMIHNSKRTSSKSSTASTSSLIPIYSLPTTVVYFPVLNMHDELIFEVRKSQLSKVAKEIREQMETSLKLSVRLPVVVKSGSTWGSLSPLGE